MDNRRLRAVLITADRSKAEQFHSRLAEEAGFEGALLEPRPGTSRWSAQIAHTNPDCILLDATDNPLAVKVLRYFQSIGSHCPIIAFADAFSPQEMLPLLRAGAFELFDLHTTATRLAEIRGRLLRQMVTKRTPMPRPSGMARVAAFTASKPGAGASTLALHSASALRRITGQRVLLIDFNPECVLAPEARIQWNGIAIDPPPASSVPLAFARARIHEASGEFDWIILDLPCAASQLTSSLAPELADVVLAATGDLAGVRMAHRSLQMLTRAGAPAANIRLALNRVTSHEPLTAADVELALKHKVEWKVPDDRRGLQSSHDWGLTGDSPLSLAFRDIATGLINGLRTPPEPAQFFWMSRCEEVLA